ncbi:hypothetical protein GX48_07272 [Paracoccidioides brasiliensis]|nr:hypothetical protein GX48_07272 [Paracoccidioides brasiliensis]
MPNAVPDAVLNAVLDAVFDVSMGLGLHLVGPFNLRSADGPQPPHLLLLALAKYALLCALRISLS